MQKLGWILFFLTVVFALAGAAPFGGGVFLATATFLLALVPTWHGAILPGSLSALGLLLALAITPVGVMKFKVEPGYLLWLAVLLFAFACSFSHGLRVRRTRHSRLAS